MNLANLTATKLRLILSVLLFVITGIGVGIFYFANTMLSDVAQDVSKTVAEADASQNNLQTLQKLERELESKEEVVERAGHIIANSQSYQYQNQIINDLNRYAARSGITLTNIDFSAATSKTTGGTAPPIAATPGGSPAASVGGQTATISVTLDNPVNYLNLLRFMQSIEQNLTKMQIANVSLTQDGSSVSSDVLSITVHVR